MATFYSVHRLFAVTLILVLATSVCMAQAPTSLEGHTEPGYDAVFTPDGKWVITASFDKTLRLWDSQRRRSVRTMSGHTGLVLSIAVHPDGSRIASGAMDNTIKSWEVPVNAPVASHAGHQGAVRSLAITKDGKWIISGGTDKTVRVRAAAAGARFWTPRGAGWTAPGAATRASLSAERGESEKCVM